ncbi:unnamed protein product [Eruca vesicaria subsp. sativa]|uniref:HTH La-type RNA-binding domain-containing protein n=1 Tax=Eruca vesicaria subsp. sativa TaxID=29727 RepID=A0ABC8JFB3_ERUVS|nr:unnamed protein product [Eruca vesicaria subsp. sativa]
MASATSNNPNSSSPHTSETQSPRRPSRQVSSPWTQIVRGGDSDPTIAAATAAAAQSKPPIEPIASPLAGNEKSSHLRVEEKSEESGAQSNAGKKPVWKRPSNGGGGGAASSEVGPVMGASSWPALSEAANNKSSSDVIVAPPVIVSQGIVNASVPSAPKQVSRGNPNQTPNNSRQRSFKRNNSSGSSANGTAPQQSAQGSLAESPSHNPSPRGQNQRNGFPSQTHGASGGGGGENVSQRDSYRNQNGNHHQTHGGGRRNHEHGNQNWGFSRSFNGRDGNVQSQRGGAPAFVRHPPPPPPVQTIPPQFIAAQPFATPLPFPPELASQYYQRMPFVAPPLSPGPVYFHVQDPPLNIKLQKQIHYYFSEENLIKDTYLRGKMDGQGFVPIPVIAAFNKVAELTVNVQQIADALQGSPVVEVQGERIRKRYNWQHWLLPKGPDTAVSSPQSVAAVASRVGNLALGESSADPNGGSSGQVQPAEADGATR